MSMSTEAAFAVFVCTQQVVPIPGEPLLKNMESVNVDSKADLLGLVLVLALTGCTESETTKNRDAASFLKLHLKELLVLTALCHYKLAEQHVQSARFSELPNLPKIPRAALANLDPLLEGIMRKDKTISTSVMVPCSFSEVNFDELAKTIRKALQADMFTLDECIRKRDTSRHANNSDQQNTRTMTSTQLAEHRKLTVRHWSHMEILAKPEYRGANLRVQQESFMTGSFVFYLKSLKTASVVSCVDCGPFVFGPVSELLLLRDLRNVTISAVCTRVQLENCHNVRLFINCECAPVVGSNCRNVVFAPYNVYYDGLFCELKYAQMELRNQNANQWDQAFCVNTTNTQSPSSVCFGPMDEEDFYIQPTPFSQNLSSNFYKFFLQTIPTAYLNNFLKKRAVAQKWVLRNPEHKLVGLSDIDQTYLLRRIEQAKTCV
ncbi:TBCC domain-containing protein 1 [Aphelenchoides bicaudatus]|nr:TBCC domain-containing protein 1 [Aphelenchoides bicaudatus]